MKRASGSIGTLMMDLARHEWPAGGTDAGAAAPVAFLVHGITSWWKTWWRVAPALAERGWRVVAVDQRAHGRSPAGGVATIEDLADDLEASIEAEATAPIDVLIGHSLGAAVSMELAHRRPRIARRLVLEDPPGVERSDDLEFQEHLAAEVAAARERPDDEIRRELLENPLWHEEDARQDVEGRALCQVDVIIESLRQARGFHVPELAAEIRIPTRYILAAEDRSVITGAARAQLMANLPAGSDAVVLDGGHTLHRDRFEEYMATLLDFLG